MITARELLGSQEAHEHLVSSLCTVLKLNGIPCSRVNQRPVHTIRGWRCQGAEPGFPDIVAVLPPAGRVLLVEAKSGNAELSQIQRDFRDRWIREGAAYVVARTVDDLKPYCTRTR